MKIKFFFFILLINVNARATPHFASAEPAVNNHYQINTPALCATAKETLTYLNRGSHYDPRVIHSGKVLPIPLERAKATLTFICQHQQQMNDPNFVKQHFEFIRWYPDLEQAKKIKFKNSLAAQIPQTKILMTKYYVHRAKVAQKRSPTYPFALYAVPIDEALLSNEEADKNQSLTRFHYGKQAILNGALNNKNVPVLAYVKRDDLEAALMQGSIEADFGASNSRIFNVNRCNNIPYNRMKNPYKQDRYWYFKQVNGIKGYGKDAEHKITINYEATFAADLEQFGLGKVLLIQYPKQNGQIVTRAGVFADTGGAFQNNLYQVDFLSGSYAGKEAFYRATSHLPNYVNAYFMVLKK